MHPTTNTARVAGLLYPLIGIPGAFSLMYVPRTLIVPGNATATANNILASEMLGDVPALIIVGIALIALASPKPLRH